MGDFITMTRNGLECSKHYTKINKSNEYLGCFEHMWFTYFSIWGISLEWLEMA